MGGRKEAGKSGGRMPKSKTTGKESAHASTLRGAKKKHAPDCESVARFAETMRLRSLATATQQEYMRFVRKLAARHGGDPAALDEAAVRAHLLRLKDEHHYSPSSMRTAVAAMRAYFGLHLGRDWRFDFAQGPEPVEGEAVRSGALALGAKAAGCAHARRGRAAVRNRARAAVPHVVPVDLRVRVADR